MTPIAKKVDRNHAEIRQAFRDCGCLVHDTSAVGRGFPDLVVSIRGKLAMVEVKFGKGKLNPIQDQFHKIWSEHVYIVNSVDEAIKLIGGI